MAPIEGEIYCTQEKSNISDITVKPGKSHTIGYFSGASVGVMCNREDSSGMALITGDIEYLGATRIEATKDGEIIEETPLDICEPIIFKGMQKIVIYSTLESHTEEIHLQHIDPHLPGNKRFEVPLGYVKVAKIPRQTTRRLAHSTSGEEAAA